MSLIQGSFYFLHEDVRGCIAIKSRTATYGIALYIIGVALHG